MAVIETWFHQDLQEPVKVNYLNGNLFSNNGNGNRIGIVLTNNGENLSSISGTVSGYVVTADGSTVPCTGSKSGNRASILIPAAAYQPGSIFITVFVTDGTTVTTIGAVCTTVMRSRTNAQVDPGSTVTDWTQTINAAMQSVETAAANLGGIVAVPYASITFPVPLGKYTYYNNNLYRCITPIASSESFTAAHWIQVRLGDDVSDLKSGFTSFEAIENELQASSVSVGTKTTGSGYYTKLPVTLVNGVFYCMKFTVSSSAPATIDLTTTESTSTIIETLAKNVQLTAGENCFIFKKTSSKVYVRIEVNGSIITQGTTLTFTKTALDVINNNINLASVLSESNFVDYGEAMSDMQAVGTASITNGYSAAIPASMAYGNTFLAEFELANDIDNLFLTLNQTESYSTAKKTIYNKQPLKAGKHAFIFKRASDMNYLRGEVNGSVVPSLSFTFYNVEKNNIPLLLRSYGNLVNSSNYSTRLPDLNNALTNTTYICFVTTTGYPANLPIAITGYTTFVVFTLQEGSNRYQFFVHSGRIYTRTYNGTAWTDWASFYDYISHYYIVDHSYTDGTKDNSGNIRYSSLAKAIEEAIKYPHSTVYVNAGTYDILSEYQTLHPDDWSTRNDGRGINLNNDIKLIFSSKAVVECKYTGNDTNVMENFSAFNVRYGDAEIINANIDASKIRYCVHDDMYSSSSPYHVHYKNCIMKIDNSGNSERSKYPHCIGGGFGQNAHIVIENCVFHGIGGNGTTNPAPDDNAIVNWHNGPNASQKSDLFMNGCYFKGTGTFGASSHGTATEVSTLLISGNSFGSNIIVREPESGNPVNIEVIAFNNEVRTS